MVSILVNLSRLLYGLLLWVECTQCALGGRCIWRGLGGLFYICEVELVYSFVQFFCFLRSIDYGK